MKYIGRRSFLSGTEDNDLVWIKNGNFFVKAGGGLMQGL